MGQTMQERWNRIKNGCCPIHGIGMEACHDQTYVINGDIPSYSEKCCRKDCLVSIHYTLIDDTKHCKIKIEDGPQELMDMLNPYLESIKYLGSKKGINIFSI